MKKQPWPTVRGHPSDLIDLLVNKLVKDHHESPTQDFILWAKECSLALRIASGDDTIADPKAEPIKPTDARFHKLGGPDIGTILNGEDGSRWEVVELTETGVRMKCLHHLEPFVRNTFRTIRYEDIRSPR